MEDKVREYEIFVEAREKANYYKGEILPFVNKICRKDMTSGDIDGFVWDYKKKKYYLIEQKRINERHKDSQNLHLIFMHNVLIEASNSERFFDYEFGVFKIIGNPPFQNCVIQKIDNYDCEKKNVTRFDLINFLNLDVSFDDL